VVNWNRFIPSDFEYDFDLDKLSCPYDHRMGNMNLSNWLKRIIQERLDIEETAFIGSKKDLLAKNSR